MRRALALIALLSAAPPVVADEGLGLNLSFEDLVERADGSTGLAGWTLRGDGIEVRLDNEVLSDGAQSLRFRYLEDGRSGLACQTLPVDEVRGRTLIFGGYLRGEGVDGSYSGLFVRVDGEAGLLALARSDLHEPRASFPWTRFEVRIPVDRRATAVHVGVDARGEGTLWVDDLYLASERTPRSGPSDEVVAYLDAAWELFTTHSILRDEVDWEQLREDTERQLRGAEHPDQAWPALRGALSRIGDNHSFFRTPEEYLRIVGRRPSPQQAEESTPTAQLLDGGVGYLMVPRLVNAEQNTVIAYANILQTLLRRAEEHAACGYVVDLRGNTGGNLWPMLLGLGPLIGEGELGAYVDVDGVSTPWVHRDGGVYHGEQHQMTLNQPLATITPAPPVAVLTDARTASSGEALAVAFRGRPDTLSFGQDTYGISTTNRGFALSDGARIFLTTIAVADRSGRAYGKRIEVERPVAVGEAGPADAAPGDDPVVQAARDWLREAYACG